MSTAWGVGKGGGERNALRGPLRGTQAERDQERERETPCVVSLLLLASPSPLASFFTFTLLQRVKPPKPPLLMHDGYLLIPPERMIMELSCLYRC